MSVSQLTRASSNVSDMGRCYFSSLLSIHRALIDSLFPFSPLPLPGRLFDLPLAPQLKMLHADSLMI